SFDPGAPDYGQRLARARTFVTHAVSLSPGDFEQVKEQLAMAAVGMEREADQHKEVQKSAARRAADPYRWFVEEVLLSRRSADVLRARRGGANSPSAPAP